MRGVMLGRVQEVLGFNVNAERQRVVDSRRPDDECV